MADRTLGRYEKGTDSSRTLLTVHWGCLITESRQPAQALLAVPAPHPHTPHCSQLPVCTPDSSKSELWQTTKKQHRKPVPVGHGENRNLNFSSILGKAKGKLSASSMWHCRIRRRHTSSRILSPERTRSVV